MMGIPEDLFLTEQFLMAMPDMQDPNFSRTVTCVCEHNSNGAVGVVINRVHPNITCKDIFDELEITRTAHLDATPVFIGGPVNAGEIFVLHGQPLQWEGSLIVSSSLAISNTKDILSAIAAGTGPESFLLALGCAGWGPGQLESEIKSNVWLTGEMSDQIIFQTPVESRWEEAVKRVGIDPFFIANTAGHA